MFGAARWAGAARFARLVSARGWTEVEALRRLHAQRPKEYFASVADEVLDNRGPEAAPSAAASAALDQLLARFDERLGNGHPLPRNRLRDVLRDGGVN